MMLGDPQSWKRQFISLDERMLQRVLHVWSRCVARLPGQPEEDDITTNLIDLLLKDPVVRTLCHWIEYQFEPFGTDDQGAKYSKGIVDLAVLLDFDRETYLPYECKRLNTIHQGRRSSLATPYVNDGARSKFNRLFHRRAANKYRTQFYLKTPPRGTVPWPKKTTGNATSMVLRFSKPSAGVERLIVLTGARQKKAFLQTRCSNTSAGWMSRHPAKSGLAS